MFFLYIYCVRYCFARRNSQYSTKKKIKKGFGVANTAQNTGYCGVPVFLVISDLCRMENPVPKSRMLVGRSHPNGEGSCARNAELEKEMSQLGIAALALDAG